METRKCKRCGKLFIPTSGRQYYCNEEIVVNCSVCGKPINTVCNDNKIPSTCSRSCGAKATIIKDCICPICGDKFLPATHRQVYCKKPIEKNCEICGKPYMSFCGDKKSPTCENKQCKNKYKQIQLENHFLQTERVCVLCGETYHPTNNAQKYCKKLHPIPCKVCGKIFITDTSKQDFATTCSKECRYKSMIDSRSPEEVAIAIEKAKKTNLEKYGVEHPAQNPEVMKKMQKTSLERYGDTSYVRTAEYIEKAKKTNNERYGVDWPGQTEQIKEKRKQTNIERYGVENPASLEKYIQKAKDTYFDKTGYTHPFENPEVIDKRDKTNLERYGFKIALKNPEIKEKAKQTMIEHYGVDSPLKSKEILNKVYETTLERYGNISYLGSEQNRKDMKQKMLEKYGVNWHSKSKQWKADRMVNPEKIDNWLKFLDNPRALLESYESKPSLRQLGLDLGVTDGTISHWISYYKLSDLIKYTLSYAEEIIVDLIKYVDSNIDVIQHNRSLLPGNELDIILPEYKLAIECNPTSTHNSSICNPWGSPPKYEEYHKQKTDRCEEVGYTLFHIFGYELTNRMDFVESNIRYLIDKPKFIVNGSDCSIINIDKDLSDLFIQKNSINPPTKASVRYGLLIDDKLVSVMTFGKLHKSKYITDTENSWEILNMCTKLHTKVVNGYSILFNKFIDEFNPNYILATSDRSWESEKDYETLGFSKIDITKPSCIWIDSKTDLPYYEYETRKCNLKKLLEGVEIDSEKTEKEILEENGFLQVFDSGKTIWKF